MCMHALMRNGRCCLPPLACCNNNKRISYLNPSAATAAAPLSYALQVDVPARADTKDWPLLHATTRLLREALGLLELAAKAGSDHDKAAAERLARK
jgi:hypothetical protein